MKLRLTRFIQSFSKWMWRIPAHGNKKVFVD